MKILMTGMTSLQHGSNKSSVMIDTQRRIQKIDVPHDIYKCLQELGHDVDWRKTQYGEDLSAYDAFFVGIGPMLSINSAGGALGALWAMHQAARKPVVVFYDDWQIDAVKSHAGTFLRRHDEYLHKKISDGKGGECGTFYDPKRDPNPEPFMGEILDALEWFSGKKPWPAYAKAGCPLYAWGNRNVLRDSVTFDMDRLVEIDPSGVVPLPQVEFIHNKWTRWILCALNDHTEWVKTLELQWPVDFFGCKKRNDIRLRNEWEVVRECNERWGILSPPYPNAGSGWFRSRFMYTVHIGSVIYCTQAEREAAGLPPFSPTVFEKYGAGDKRKLAEKQAKIVKKQLGTKEKFRDQVSKLWNF